MNIFDSIPEHSESELFHILASSDSVRIERIVSFGQASAPDFWYDQAENEWVLVLEGSAELSIESNLIHLKPGDYILIPAGVRHRVERTDLLVKSVWLAVFYR